jgi:hypothetical protein
VQQLVLRAWQRGSGVTVTWIWWSTSSVTAVTPPHGGMDPERLGAAATDFGWLQSRPDGLPSGLVGSATFF